VDRPGRVDEYYMKMALALARRGIGLVEPNPAVGCVIVKAGQVIGRGWHRGFGKAHAEVEALRDCRRQGLDPAGATMYVTLEPCCHFGKTGPCTKEIIQARIAKVVVATGDPSGHANGAGLEILRQAGIEVQVGVCQAQARLLNGPFFKFVQTGRPWVIVKWAQSIDGMLAIADPSAGRYLTSQAARNHAHILRRRTQAIVVGINTVLQDDPLLTPRPSKGRRPIRVVMDRGLRIPLDARILLDVKTFPVLICTTRPAMDDRQAIVQQLQQRGAEFLVGPDDDRNIGSLLDELARRSIQQVLIEGGARLIRSALQAGLADEIHLYIAPISLGNAGKARIEPGYLMLRNPTGRQVGPDVWLSGLTDQGYNLCVDIPKDCP
jgi:diaminohydroxyphosphoribosylaminopyrimidine deaminase/5-amino-6-(5-phosphoribosylamino)uracil reductase